MRKNAEQAKKLVMYSHIFGWGGLGMLFVLAPVFGRLTSSGTVGVVVGLLGFASAITGAIVGQVGRAMQGRVI